MSAATTENLYLTTVPAAKVKKLAKYFLNTTLYKKTVILQSERKPIEKADKLLKAGKDKVLDEKGNVKLDSEGKPMMRALTDAEIKSYTDIIKSSGARRKEIEDTLKAYTRCRIKFKDRLAFMLSVLYDDLVREMFTHAADNSVADGKGQVNIATLLRGIDKNFKYYDLIRNLDSYVNAVKSVQYDIDQQALREANRIKKQPGKKKKTEDGEKPDEKEKVAEKAPEPRIEVAKVNLTAEEQIALDMEYPHQFLSYVNSIAKSVICPNVYDGKDVVSVRLLKYKDVKFSGETKKLVSTLLVELTRKICFQVIIQLGDNKVTSDKLLCSVLQGMMDSSANFEEHLVKITERINPEERKAETKRRKEWNKLCKEAKLMNKPAPPEPVWKKESEMAREQVLEFKVDRSFDRSAYSHFRSVFDKISGMKEKKISSLMKKEDLVMEIYVPTQEELEKKAAKKTKKETTGVVEPAKVEPAPAGKEVEAPAPVVEVKKETPAKKSKKTAVVEPAPTPAPTPVEVKTEMPTAPAPTKKRAPKVTAKA